MIARACTRCGRATQGPCPTCSTKRDHARGTSTARGYGYWWTTFRQTYVRLLTAHNIAPICGASLPDGPHTRDSQCAQDGVITWGETGRPLHFDHEPPLTLIEQHHRDRSVIGDPRRIQLLCPSCHAAKTARQTG